MHQCATPLDKYWENPYFLDDNNSVEWDSIQYSQQDTIQAFLSYYKFLIELYAPEAELLVPPEGGWPGITQESFKHFGKSAEVVELLKHLPYLGSVEIVPCGLCLDYRHEDLLRKVKDEELASHVRTDSDRLLRDTLPPHVFGLTTGDREAPQILLDTKRGLIYWYHQCPFPDNPGGRRGIGQRIPPEGSSNERDWRESFFMPVVDFFEFLKDEFRAMRMVPYNRKRVTGLDMVVGCGEENEVELIQCVLRNHGWLEKHYRKDDCLQDIASALEEKSPDGLCGMSEV